MVKKDHYSKKYYDLDTIQRISILDVCSMLGLKVTKRGKNYWCKVRPEKTPSVILHPDRNTFYDFGNMKHGGNVKLVQYVKDCSFRDGVSFIADSFNLVPVQGKEQLMMRPLENWEYECIGLYGDMASKNISFPIETASLDELSELSYSFRMSMNDLRKLSLTDYESIIQNRAVPYVESLKNCYYSAVWNYYDFLRMFNRGAEFFDSDKTRIYFSQLTKNLYRAESILYRAAYNTHLKVSKPHYLDPLRVLSHMMQGRIKMELGNSSPDEIKEKARNRGCNVCSVEYSYDEYFEAVPDNIDHCAVFNGAVVFVQYLSDDYFMLTMPKSSEMHSKLDDEIKAIASSQIPYGRTVEQEYVL